MNINQALRLYNGIVNEQKTQTLLNIANSKENEYGGPVKSIETGEVIINKNTRKMTIIYNLVSGKRKVEKTFTHLGQRYKIYTPWEYTRSQKKNTYILTDDFLNTILSSNDEIIIAHRDKILSVLPIEIKTPTLIRMELEQKYATKKLNEPILKEYEKQIMAINFTQNNIQKNIAEVKKKIDDSQNEINILENRIKTSTVFVQTIEKKFFSFFQKKKIENAYSLISQNKIRINDLSEKNLTFERRLEELTSLLIEEQNKENYLNRQRSLVEKRLEEENKIKIDNELKEILKSKEENFSFEIKDGPSKEWKKEERAKMERQYKDGKTLREYILLRDNYTCRKCGNSIYKEANLLLEVDHITPISKYGPSIPENLQTLCWRCNREKSDK